MQKIDLMQKWLPLLSGQFSSTTYGATSKGNEIIHYSEKLWCFWVKDDKVLIHFNLRDLYEKNYPGLPSLVFTFLT